MLREVPKKHVTLYKKAMSGKSRKAAIRSFCLECMGYKPPEIEVCTDVGCPLYQYRERG